jgi:hypothetical protein
LRPCASRAGDPGACLAAVLVYASSGTENVVDSLRSAQL